MRSYDMSYVDPCRSDLAVQDFSPCSRLCSPAAWASTNTQVTNGWLWVSHWICAREASRRGVLFWESSAYPYCFGNRFGGAECHFDAIREVKLKHYAEAIGCLQKGLHYHRRETCRTRLHGNYLVRLAECEMDHARHVCMVVGKLADVIAACLCKFNCCCRQCLFCLEVGIWFCTQKGRSSACCAGAACCCTCGACCGFGA